MGIAGTGRQVRRTSAVFRLSLIVAAVAAIPAFAESPAAGEAVPEPDGYRMEDYRAPVPSTLTGGTVVDTEEAVRLHAGGVPFIDVLPRVPRPKNLPEGTIWRPEPRKDIPGSIWLVDTGYGELAPVMERYFFDGIESATKGEKSAPVLFYCKRDCWMSYNAARRAIASGYKAVYWYPDGTEGWAEAGRPLEKREPEPRPDE
ncbi:PQQ-dependent catabolism-associated CXXCW motif protein [Jiella endophytica]|uniref:PQQ-dependent catabolism-associated CXXCW motif protein n=1 Tax=Jiella endophytica TaxID=2558362 RepID=A0A4Y8RIZ9_9HYPH|nr:PQQ-dependent catabolism-associated CXXCW motif protein [Jiella endophytica]TFF21944.1 PQQ-dependent catabolism-associated CXXCW motif protein [Jiella endophytica]